MSIPYDTYYRTKNLFGDPYPELIEFFANYPKKGKVLDLGCGQGRDALALARLGYSVTGMDNSAVGISQMSQVANTERLDLIGKVGDLYGFNQFEEFDIILLDSMFHFQKKDREKETGLIEKIISQINPGSILVVCIQDTAAKVAILNQSVDREKKLKRLADKTFSYTFEDKESGHKSSTDYRMMVVQK